MGEGMGFVVTIMFRSLYESLICEQALNFIRI